LTVAAIGITASGTEDWNHRNLEQGPGSGQFLCRHDRFPHPGRKE